MNAEPVVELPAADARAAVVVLGALIRERAVGARPVPHKVRQLHSRLALIVETSSPRGHSEGDGVTASLIGTRLAAEIVGRGERWVRRHSADLEGGLVGDRMLYPERAVREYAEVLQGKEIHQ